MLVQGSLQYRGPMDVMRQVVKGEGGVLGLYKGFVPTMVREVAGCSAMFAAYEAMKLAAAKQQVPCLCLSSACFALGRTLTQGVRYSFLLLTAKCCKAATSTRS